MKATITFSAEVDALENVLLLLCRDIVKTSVRIVEDNFSLQLIILTEMDRSCFGREVPHKI